MKVEFFHFDGTGIRPEVTRRVPIQPKRQDQQQNHQQEEVTKVPIDKINTWYQIAGDAHKHQKETSDYSNDTVSNEDELRCDGNEFQRKPTDHVRGHDAHLFGCVVWNW